MKDFTELPALAARPRNRSRGAPLTSPVWTDVIKAWDRTTLNGGRGGTIVCASPGAAVNLRQRMYRYRSILSNDMGGTPYDTMIIKLEKGDHRLEVRPRAEGFLEIIDIDVETTEIANAIIVTPLEVEE